MKALSVREDLIQIKLEICLCNVHALPAAALRGSAATVLQLQGDERAAAAAIDGNEPMQKDQEQVVGRHRRDRIWTRKGWAAILLALYL